MVIHGVYIQVNCRISPHEPNISAQYVCLLSSVRQMCQKYFLIQFSMRCLGNSVCGVTCGVRIWISIWLCVCVCVWLWVDLLTITTCCSHHGANFLEFWMVINTLFAYQMSCEYQHVLRVRRRAAMLFANLSHGFWYCFETCSSRLFMCVLLLWHFA